MARFKNVTTGVAFASAALVLAACGSSSSAPSPGTTTGSGSTAAPSPSRTFAYTSDNPTTKVDGAQLKAQLGAAPTGKNYKIAVVLKALTNQYWQGIEAGVKQAAADLGVTATVQAATSESDPNEQLTITQTLVSQGYDAFVLAPQTTSNLNPAVEQLKTDNIPVVNVDDARIGATTYVGPNHELNGLQAAESFAKLFPSGGQVAQIEGQAGSSAAILRIKGFKDGVAKAGNLQLVASVPGDWDGDKAFAAAQQIIAQYPDLKGIYANNDTMAIGVAKAVEASGKDVKVIGTDGVPEAVDAIRKGTMYATVSPLPYYQGYWALESAVRLLGGQDVPQWVVSPAQLITKENVDQFYDDKGFVKQGLF